MRIAVISDTHDRLPGHVSEAISGADEIWHLGDVCLPGILHGMEGLGPVVRVVRGNCDSCIAWPLALQFRLEDLNVRLGHVPPSAGQQVDLVLHGHTHVPRNESIGGTRFLNPGSIPRPNRGAPASY